MPAELKARWVRESRAVGMTLTDWILQRMAEHAEKSARPTDERAATDPAFAERRARAHREAVRRYWSGLSPEQLERYRAVRRNWFKNLTPEQRALRKSWYRELTPELKRLFLTELRRKRKLALTSQAPEAIKNKANQRA